MNEAAPKVTVSARRNIKGARRRELATHVADKPVGLSWLPNGAVDAYFATADGMCHVWLSAEVVARIAAGKPATPAPQVVPPLDGHAGEERAVCHVFEDDLRGLER